MITVNIHEAKTQLSALLHKIEVDHETIRLCRNGKPIADIVPIEAGNDPMKMHSCLYKGAKISYDPTEPLTQDEWPDAD